MGILLSLGEFVRGHSVFVALGTDVPVLFLWVFGWPFSCYSVCGIEMVHVVCSFGSSSFSFLNFSFREPIPCPGHHRLIFLDRLQTILLPTLIVAIHGDENNRYIVTEDVAVEFLTRFAREAMEGGHADLGVEGRFRLKMRCRDVEGFLREAEAAAPEG